MTDAQLLEWYDKMEDTEAVFFRKAELDYHYIKVKDFFRIGPLLNKRALEGNLISIKSPEGGDIILSAEDLVSRLVELVKKGNKSE